MEVFTGKPTDPTARLDKEMRVYDLLDRLEIDYKRVDHPAAMTMDDCTGADNVAWMNKLGVADGAKEIFTQCIVFESSFRSPEKGGGAWEAGKEYTWSWYLARSEGGKWKLMTWGY